MESGDTRSAIADYNHSLELKPGRADVHERLALAYFKQGSRPEAIAQWKLVFSTLSKEINGARVPESFWVDFANACEHLRSRKLFGELRPEVDALLRDYLHKNGNYRSNAPLQSAFVALGNPTAGMKWIVELSSAAANPVSVLTDIVDAPWIPLAQRAPIYQRILEVKSNAAAKLEGLEKENAQAETFTWQLRWARYLVKTKQFAQAGEYLTTLSPEMQAAQEANVVPLALQVAAKLGTLEARIASYQENPQSAPAADVLRSSAKQLYESGDKQSARKLLEYVLAKEIDNHNLVATNFLGLAEIRIAAGDVPGAIELLRRLVIVVGEPYQNLDSAAALLEKMGRNGEAIEFLEQLVKASPWETSYQMRLAKERIGAGKDAIAAQESLKTIVASKEVGYRTRVEAAVALRTAHVTTDTGSEELKLLAGDARGLSTSAADQPFFYDARLRAAENQTDASSGEKLLEKAVADFPARDEARLTVFKMAVARHEDEFALASIEGMLRELRIRSVAPNQSGAEEEIISAGEPEPEQDDGETEVASSTRLQPEQQAQIAWAVGEVLVRLNRDGEAQQYLLVAQKLEKATARRKEIRQELLELKTRLRREQINAGRQPILHADLEQDRLVRPRIVASQAMADTAAPRAEDHP
jgi:tetratricopeptide (TPR) repeat protein